MEFGDNMSILNTSQIQDITSMVVQKVEELEPGPFTPSLKLRYHISPWLIKTVIECYFKYRYEAVE